MNSSEYQFILVESFIPSDTSGRHGPIHIRPLPNQDPFKTTMFVECSKNLSYDYAVGTKFRIKAKITRKEGRAEFIYSHYSWPFEVIE
ncbi:MAG: hypothetical protein ACOVOQ_00510 [Flavobacterium sp.]